MDSAFLQIGVVTILAAGLGILFRFLRQPIILAYIAAGILLGAGGLNLIHNAALTADIATIGIIFLLFLVGLELDINQVRRLGPVVVVVGLLQMLITFGLAFGAAQALGYGATAGIYLGLATAFSSTAVVLKRLSDRSDLGSLYAKVSVGILLLQDVVAILCLMVISGVSGNSASPALFAGFLIKGAIFIALTWVFTRYLLGRVFFYIAKSHELLFLASVAWAFLFALISDALGFSKEIGAFLAGLSLATLPYNLEIIGRVKPLKDFFLVIFFVVLGLEVGWPAVVSNLPLVAALAAIVIFAKSFAGAAVMVRLGYPKRPAYLTGAVLGQMSEFSLLVVLLGASAGHIGNEIVGITAALLALTIVLNTYWNDLNRYIYPVLSKPLNWFSGRIATRELAYRPRKKDNHILLFGANRIGAQMLRTLERLKKDVLVVDHNPEVIRRLLRRGVESVYGDIDDFELLKELGVADAKMVISTVPNTTANIYLIEETRKHNTRALVITMAEQVDDALAMYAAGADYVVLPHLLGGERAAEILEKVESREVKPAALRKQRTEHVHALQARRHELIG